MAEPRCGEVHIEMGAWGNWNDLLRYVVRPLINQGFAPEVRGKIDASSTTGVSTKLLREQIEVSLQQLGIQDTLDSEPIHASDCRPYSTFLTPARRT